MPHHLIDIVEPTEEFSVAQYVEAAQRAVDEIQSPRSASRLFVGGTPLYLKALLRGMFEGPPADWELRRRARSRSCETAGHESLHERLRKVDPVAAAAAAPPRHAAADPRAGSLRADRQADQPRCNCNSTDGRRPHECRVFVLDWPREELYERIDAPRRCRCSPPGWSRKTRGLIAATAASAAPPAGRRLSRSASNISPADCDLDRNHRTRKDPHPPVRQAPAHLVPQLERMPRCSGWRTL